MTVKPKTEKELKKEAEKAAKIAKFEEKQKKLAEKQAQAKPKEEKKDVVKKDKRPAIVEYTADTKEGEKKDITGEMPSAYNPRYVETAWYQWWEKQGFFKPEYGGRDITKPNPKGNFTICIPPPNVTGTLHVGHALATTVEDTLIRVNRMKGKTTLFNPGCDHAGIATQVVVEKRLKRERGLSRHDLGRERFIQEVWHWKNEKGDVIYDQLRKMGASVDWDRACFMMDPKMMRAVTEAFIRMQEKGVIYRSNRLVNWSCALRSAISDIEVDKKELPGRTLLPVPGYSEKIEFGVIVSFAYKIKDSDEEIVVSTTRLETMLGDSGIAVHPEDPRYKHLVGKSCVHPFVDRLLPIVADSFVERDFGTGAVKITPAHDHNDYEVGQRNNLPFITCITDDGLIASGCGQFSGMKRFDARSAVTDALKEKGLYRDKKDNEMVVPICSRSKDIIEPILKAQWYVKCDDMAARAIKVVESGEIKIIPDIHVATWNRWLQSSRFVYVFYQGRKFAEPLMAHRFVLTSRKSVHFSDWCISRQLWWGHRIPAYFITVNDGKDIGNIQTPAGDPCDDKYWVSAHSEEDARKKAAAKFNVAEKQIQLKWDEDVLDTWFSSGMWPFAIFGWPNKTSDLKAFFPGAVLETGHDILFFWVARMVFMSQELCEDIPFKEVYLHAMIRDAHGRKMSKSLGNVIDPLDVIRGVTLAELNKQLLSGNLDDKEIVAAQAGQAADYPNGIPECGTDALRFALLAYTSQGRDINLDVLRVQGYRFFCNKIWQAVKFTLMQLGTEYVAADTFKLVGSESVIDKWILSRAARAVAQCNTAFDEYNFTQVTSTLHQFWLYDLCDVYLESVKPVIAGDNADAKAAARSVLLHCVETGLRLLSPIMPFISEELWQRLPRRKTDAPAIIVAPYPENQQFPFVDESLEANVSFAMDVVKTVRSLRSDYELTNKTKADLYLSVSNDGDKQSLSSMTTMIGTLASSSKVTVLLTSETSSVPAGCAQVTVSARCTVFIALQSVIDVTKELAKLCQKREKTEAAVKKVIELEAGKDYETKVPLGVRTNNAEKRETLKKEIISLDAAIDALKSLQN